MPHPTASRPQWSPKYEEFAVSRDVYGRTLEDDPGLESGSTSFGSEEWVIAPATSHCEGFRYIDVRAPQNKWLKKIGAPSELQVRFKATATSGPRLYSYFFRGNHDEGRAIFDRMVAASSPWGEVGYPELVEGKVEYRRRT